MVEKSYFSALRNGTKARKYAEELIEKDPDFVDGYLVPGVQEYVVGSLPWAVKMLAAIGGVRGNKNKGREWVERVADDGSQMQTEAKVLLTLLYRRESRPLDAARVLQELIRKYPRNYVLRLELGSMWLDAQEKEKGLEIFQSTKRMVEQDENRFRTHAGSPQESAGAQDRGTRTEPRPRGCGPSRARRRARLALLRRAP